MRSRPTAQYFQILGLTEQASVDEIKQAFRRKAKQLHPDRNPSPQAHQEFILLNEAYDYLIDLKTKGRAPIPETTPYEQWRRQQAELNRQRAQAYAQMRYEEYLKTDGYKATSSWALIGEHLYYIFAIAMISVVPLGATLLYGWRGLGLSLLAMLFTSPFTLDVLREKPKRDWPAFWSAVIYVSKTQRFQVVGITLFNILVFLKIGFQTLIPLHYSLGFMAVAMVLVFAFTRWQLQRSLFQQYFFALCLAPLFLNLLFICNFIFSRYPVQETYTFSNEWQATTRGYQKSTLIVLQDYKYDAFPGIRVFWNYSAMQDKYEITYTFEDGLLGVRVMTDFYFGEAEQE